MDLVLTVIGIIGNMFSVLLFLSPSPTFWQIIKLRSVRSFSEVPYICALANCIIWVFYGLPLVSKNNILVVTINGFGTALESIYLIIYMVFSHGKHRIRIILSILVEVSLYAGFVVVSLLFFVPRNHRAMFVGIVAACFNTVMYASPLSVIRTVIRSRSVDSMPFALSLCTFLNSCVWFAYSVLKRDWFIFIPNILGVILGATQLGLYGFYYSKDRPDFEPNCNSDDDKATKWDSNEDKATIVCKFSDGEKVLGTIDSHKDKTPAIIMISNEDKEVLK